MKYKKQFHLFARHDRAYTNGRLSWHFNYYFRSHFILYAWLRSTMRDDAYLML